MAQNDTLRQLSLTARLGVALICFERYCDVHQLTAPELRIFLDYLWDFPLALGSHAFQAWQRQQPELVTVGLGGDIPASCLIWLDDAGIPHHIFGQLIKHIVEIIYGSFYAAANDVESLFHLQNVLTITEQSTSFVALLRHFSRSRFVDGEGWGMPVSEAERDEWRAQATAKNT